MAKDLKNSDIIGTPVELFGHTIAEGTQVIKKNKEDNSGIKLAHSYIDNTKINYIVKDGKIIFDIDKNVDTQNSQIISENDENVNQISLINTTDNKNELIISKKSSKEINNSSKERQISSNSSKE